MRLFSFALLLITIVSCTKDPHRYIGSDNGNIWLMDEMSVTISDNGVTIADTLVSSGEFTFNKLKNKDTDGNGLVSRFEFNGTSWSTDVEEESFIWEMDGDNTILLNYQDGRNETITVVKSEKKTQEWTSESVETGDDVVRSYTLTLN